MRRAWQFVIGPASGGHEVALTAATRRRLTVRLTSPSEASFVINGRHSQAAAVDELASDLHVLYTPPAPGARTVLLYRGRIGPTGDDLDETTHGLTVSSMDYREVLSRRILYASSTLAWTATDQAEIAWQLISQTQSRAGGHLGISKGVGHPAGVLRDRTYEAGDSIGERIQELSEVIDGFDWDIRPASASALALDIWGARGADRGVVLEHGGLVRTVRREVAVTDYANSIRVTGDQTGPTPPTPQERTATDIATRPEGRWDRALTAPGIVTTATLAERADWLLDDAQVVQPSYTLGLRAGGWAGPEHLWLGDTVLLVIQSGRLAVAGVPLRVQELAFGLPDDGGPETVQVTVGRPRPNFNRRPGEILRRLADVERR